MRPARLETLMPLGRAAVEVVPAGAAVTVPFAAGPAGGPTEGMPVPAGAGGLGADMLLSEMLDDS